VAECGIPTPPPGLLGLFPAITFPVGEGAPGELSAGAPKILCRARATLGSTVSRGLELHVAGRRGFALDGRGVSFRETWRRIYAPDQARTRAAPRGSSGAGREVRGIEARRLWEDSQARRVIFFLEVLWLGPHVVEHLAAGLKGGAASAVSRKQGRADGGAAL